MGEVKVKIRKKGNDKVAPNGSKRLLIGRND